MSDKLFVDNIDLVEPGRPRGRAGSWLLFLVLTLGVLLIWPWMAGWYTEWLWYEETGYRQVFSTTLLTKFGLGAGGFIFGALFLWVNLKLALWASRERAQSLRFITINNERISVPDIAGFTERWLLPLSLLGGLWLGIRGWGMWEIILQYLHRTSFGEADPVFGRDISFYFFTLPLLDRVSSSLHDLTLIALGGVLLLNLMRSATGKSKGSGMLGDGARRHLLALAAIFFAILAGREWLSGFELLWSRRGPVNGASYTDLTALLPMIQATTFITGMLAVIAIACMVVRKTMLLWIGLALYAVALVGGQWLYPSLVQQFSVAPNELARESENITRNIAATRHAFGLDQIEERELSGEKAITREDIEKNGGTIDNIRLWDRQPLLDTFAQIQEIRTYYDFESVDNDRYIIDGRLQQTMISPRELAIESHPNRNWINERLSFTHGFGLTLGPANKVTPEGLPQLFIRDIPPVSSVPSLAVSRPEIYYGEVTHEPVYLKTTAREFNYPAGEQDVYATYEGSGGVALNSYWRKLLFATRFGDMKLLLSNDITAESRVLYHRNIKERLERIAPFLQFDSDPYLVISEGRLFWIADGYTVSDRYPYAQQYSGINYIRNSVKATIDCYNGTVTLYLADESDPVIRTWSKILPTSFRPLAEMPADLRTHLRYPEDIFAIQSSVYSTYHMNQPQMFYNKEDQWEVASLPEAEGQSKAMSPYYSVMKLPGEGKEEFILMLPFTPRSKDNLAAWMVARSDGEHYGKLLVCRFPKQRLIYGPKQVVARVNQDAEISRQLSLWDQRGSKVILGTLLVIPIEESLIYVQPLYLKAETGKIPELKRVIVTAENRIAMEETLEASLARIFGGAAAKPAAAGESASPAPLPAAPAGVAEASETTIPELATKARESYDRALQAQRAGDWAAYGEEIRRLGTILEQMSRKQGGRQ